VSGIVRVRAGDCARRIRRAALPLAVAFVSCAIEAGSSSAASASPHWSILSESEPTYFKAGDPADAYVLIVRNDGGAPTAHGSVVTVTDILPAEVTATKVTAVGEPANGTGLPKYEMACPTGPITGTVTCTYEEAPSRGRVPAGAMIVVTIRVAIGEHPGVPLGPNSATVSGGGAPGASTSATTPIDADTAPFGLSLFDIDAATEAGEQATQAGSHPYALTASMAFNVSSRETPSAGNGGAESALANASPKDIEVALPPGLVGDPNAVPRCSQQAFLERERLNCPVDTQVGTVKPLFYGTFQSAFFPVFNIVPPSGQPGELGFSVAGIGHVPLFFHVRSNGDYGLTAQLDDMPEAGPLQGAILTLWGVPAAPAHNLEREGTLGEGAQNDGEFCKPSVKVIGGVEEAKGCPSGVAATPFLTLPGSCTAELPVLVQRDSWQNPEPQNPLEPEPPGRFNEMGSLPATTGCEQLSFVPSLSLQPETTQAGAPSGYTVDVHVPQNESPTALATPDLRDASITLPPGAVLSPSVANGLQSCSQQQFGLHSLAPAACPPRSQIGTVTIATPLLSSPLEGHVYVGEPECAPCTPSDAQQGRLIRLLLEAQGSPQDGGYLEGHGQAGVTAKLEGATSIDQATGQLTATFTQAPQLPFEDLKLTLDGGANAPLANPTSCGAQLLATSRLTPYSSEAAAQPSSAPFQVTGCTPPQFHPSFVAGTTNNQAGASSPLTVTLSRTDQDEDLSAATVRLAPGLLGMLSKVQLCPEAQVQADACSPQSEVGTASIDAGPGANPTFIGGRVYLTGPYEGAPFGLSVVVPAVAGPFDLGTIRVGAKIEVDPRTAALTIVSDPLPQTLDGIPLQLKTIALDIDRAGFALNPTDCRPLEIEGALAGMGGATAAVSSRFQAADCATLPFKPRLSALTHAKTSKAGGAYLHMRLAMGAGGANVAAVKVDLPKQLSTRLRALQSACAAAVFDANAAACPPASAVGSVTVLTPVLRHALVGPVYLVSHGSSALPNIELVLQGEGVTVVVSGQTSITHGITSDVFTSLPDVPISTLGLVLGSGAHSLLAANLPAGAHRSMCGRRLTMRIALTGQNGAALHQAKNISVSGCPRQRRRLRG
jgi:hypothetical protein